MELNRFKQLLESTMGNVKPLLTEDNTLTKCEPVCQYKDGSGNCISLDNAVDTGNGIISWYNQNKNDNFFHINSSHKDKDTQKELDMSRIKFDSENDIIPQESDIESYAFYWYPWAQAWCKSENRSYDWDELKKHVGKCGKNQQKCREFVNNNY